jgi:hypothetical protein
VDETVNWTCLVKGRKAWYELAQKTKNPQGVVVSEEGGGQEEEDKKYVFRYTFYFNIVL